MLEIFAYILLILLAIILMYILSPLIYMLKLKLQFGKAVKIMYYPVIGNIYFFNKSKALHGDILYTMKAAAKANPEIKFIVTNLLNQPFLYIIDPEYQKLQYTEHANYEKMDPIGHNGLVRKGLVMSEGSKWKHQRAMLGAPFHYEQLKSRIPMINRVVKEHCENHSKDHIQEFNLSITGEVVIRSFFGEQFKDSTINGKQAQQEIVSLFNDLGELQFSDIYSSVKQLLLEYKSWSFFPTKKEKEILKRIQSLREFSVNLINQRIQQIQTGKYTNKVKDFLDIHLDQYLKQEKDDPNFIDIDDITHQFITLFFAGTDTTGTSSTICLHYLAEYPEIQKELFEELQQVIDIKDGDVLDIHLPKLVKMSAFINEVLRVRNPAFTPIPRKVKRNFQLKDIELKKGYFIAQANFLTQLEDKHFSNPETFDYKRWLTKDTIKNDNGFVFIPFSAGPRNCIGQHMALMELKIILSHFIRRYQINKKKDYENMWVLRFLYSVEKDDQLEFKQRI